MRVQIGYKRRWIRSGQPARVAPNRLNREFSVEARINGGSETLRTFELTKVSSIWRSFSICFRDVWWDGQCSRLCRGI